VSLFLCSVLGEWVLGEWVSLFLSVLGEWVLGEWVSLFLLLFLPACSCLC